MMKRNLEKGKSSKNENKKDNLIVTICPIDN